MRSARIWIAISLAVVALAGVVYWFSRSAPTGPAPAAEVALEWLPVESALVASLHINELRQQSWLVDLLEQAAPVEQEADYREFVAATGFDYTRDLDRLWLALLPAGSEGELIGIAQGRFEREKILAYAGTQGAQRLWLAGVAAYLVERAEPQQSFAFAFLDHARIAFAETPGGIENILACVRRAAPSIATDASRRERLEQLAAGMQAWVASEDVESWAPPQQRELANELRRLAAAARATPEGLELVAELETRQPAQASKLRMLLQTYVWAGRIATSGKTDPGSRALQEVLGRATLSQHRNWLTLRVTLSPTALADLLAAGNPPPVAQKSGRAGKSSTQ